MATNTSVRNKELRFYKDGDGGFADVAGHTQAQNRMVAGADRLIERFAAGGSEVRVRLSADVADPGEYRIKLHRAAGHELYEACFKVPEVRPGVRCPTGVYGYPIREAAEIAIREAKAVLAAYSDLEVTFCCFSAADKAVYESLLK